MLDSDDSESPKREQSASGATARDPSVKSPAFVSMTDNELMAIIEHLSPFAFMYAIRFLWVDLHEAEDLAQEALTCLVLLLRRGERPKIERKEETFDHYKPWLKEIVRRKALERNRTLKKWRSASPDAAETKDSPDNTLSIDANDEAAMVRRCLSELPDRIREAIILRYYDDLKAQEISEILNVKPNTVNKWLREGLDQLQKVLNGERIR